MRTPSPPLLHHSMCNGRRWRAEWVRVAGVAQTGGWESGNFSSSARPQSYGRWFRLLGYPHKVHVFLVRACRSGAWSLAAPSLRGLLKKSREHQFYVVGKSAGSRQCLFRRTRDAFRSLRTPGHHTSGRRHGNSSRAFTTDHFFSRGTYHAHHQGRILRYTATTTIRILVSPIPYRVRDQH